MGSAAALASLDGVCHVEKYPHLITDSLGLPGPTSVPRDLQGRDHLGMSDQQWAPHPSEFTVAMEIC